MDELVKDYLLYRGLNSTIKVLESELKNEKDKSFRVDKMMETLHSHIAHHDLTGFIEYWQFLDRRLFCRLEQVYTKAVRKLEISLLRLYLVYAIQQNKPDKVTEFFDKMTPDLQSQPEWKDWFALPFIKNAEENSSFAMYFTKQWQDTLFLSLHNFLSVIIHNMPVPALLNYEEDQKKLAVLREENLKYKNKIAELMEKKGIDGVDDEVTSPTRTHGGAGNLDVMDDFYVISQDTTIEDRPAPKSQQIKSFIKNIGSSSIMKPKAAAPATSSKHSGNQAQQPAPKEDSASSERKNKPREKVRSWPHALSSVTPAGGATGGSDNEGLTTHTESYDKTRDEEHEFDSSSDVTKDQAKNRSRMDALSRNEKAGNADTVTSHAASQITSQATHPTFTIGEDVSSDEKPLPFLLLSQEEYSEHHSSITHCRFSNGGHLVASSDIDGVVKVWSLEPSPVTIATIMSKSMLLSLEWASKMDRLLLLGSKTGSVRLFDIKEKKIVREAMADQAYPRIVSLSCSPSGTAFVCSAAGRARAAVSGGEHANPRMGKLSVWDLKTMKILRNFPLAPGPVAVNCTSYNHNGQLLVTGAADGAIRLIDMQQYECIAKWNAHAGEVYSVQFSPDETSCYSMGSDGKFTQWSINKTGRKVAQLAIHHGACGPFILTAAGGYRQVQTPKGKLFAFDPEGQHVLTCAQNGGIIYQIHKDGGLKQTLSLGGHRTPVVCSDWSSAIDCKMCLTGSMDGRVLLSTLLAQ